MHVADRDRYRVSLDAVLEQRRGKLNLDLRLRAAGGNYHWFNLKARPVIGSDGEVVRVIGTLPTSPSNAPRRSGCCTTRCMTT